MRVVTFLKNKKDTFEKLAIAIIWLQTLFKKDTTSTLGGRYNESIISHARLQTCPLL